MDFCDLDVENVDELLEGADTLPIKKEKRKRSAANQAKSVTNGGASRNASASVKSANSSWDEKFLQTNSNGNAANTDESFYHIDSLVVVNDTTLPVVSSSSNAQGVSKSRRGGGKQADNSDKSGGTAAATSAESSKSHIAASRSSSRKKSSKSAKSAATASSAPAAASSTTASSSRPRMIHTEKSRVPAENATKKSRGGRSYITRTNTSETSSQLSSQLVKSSGVSSSRIVDDYEIISPATQPPNQISSSPLHIKQEQEQQQQRIQFMFDDSHLINTSMLREKPYDKFNPSIVNDLEEILRSPLKHDRNARLRFTSESSTTLQFLPELEPNLIKIEPTSPDLRDMVESQQRVNATAGQAATPTSSSSSSAARTSRHLRQLTANGSSSRAASKRSAGKSSTAAGSSTTKPSSNTSSTEAVSKSYLSYGVDSYNVGVATSANSSDVSSGFFSISEVVSAAHAADAAKAAAASKTERRTRCFECEMCSSIFSDRAQLLEHMHIHI